MTVLELCDEIPASVPLTAMAAEAIRLMIELRVGAVAVLDEKSVVAGIFTERDVLNKIALIQKDPAHIPIIEIMTVPVIMATQETSPAAALVAMVEAHHRHLPIVAEDGRLLGMLSMRNVLQDRIDVLAAELATKA